MTVGTVKGNSHPGSRGVPRAAERGKFTMEVSFHGDPPGWWITVG
jgi:hypothetical protein